MSEDKAGKATGYIPQIICMNCGMSLWAVDREDGDGVHYEHPLGVGCSNNGKKFKVATVELEEL